MHVQSCEANFLLVIFGGNRNRNTSENTNGFESLRIKNYALEPTMASTGNAKTTTGVISNMGACHFRDIISPTTKHLTAQGRFIDRCNTGV